MPKLILIYPSIGRKPGEPFVRSWQQEPLAMAVLAALTPQEWQIRFFDDRLEKIDYGSQADLVGISIETYTARRGYQIADRFSSRGIPVVFGGYHATFRPDEALGHGDAVCIGEAEPVWKDILADAAFGTLQKKYSHTARIPLDSIRADKSIFKGKGYMPVSLIETSRGCPFRCGFCSVSAFFEATYRRRPAEQVARDLREAEHRYVFFVDDNFTGDIPAAKELCRAARGSGKRWISQATACSLRDRELVRLMAGSGCFGLLVGFESMDRGSLAAMNKGINAVDDYSGILENLRENGIHVYGTFLFGYPGGSEKGFQECVDFAIREKLYIAAFNHLVPFPGTPLHEELEARDRLRPRNWWLDKDFRFGRPPFEPECMPAEKLEELCLRARRQFYSASSIIRRIPRLKPGLRTPADIFRYFTLNTMLRREIGQKSGIPLGIEE